jgi:competence protein CoiA
LLTATDENNNHVLAWETEKGGRFYCPECRGDLILRKGEIKTHHFAHRVEHGCDYGGGETELHREAKMGLYRSLESHPDVLSVGLEVPLGKTRRADVMIVTKKSDVVVVELQRSNLSIADIRQRTLDYTAMKIPVIWIAIGFQPKHGIELRIKEWQQWLHAMWYGQLFTWFGGSLVQAWKLDTVTRYGEEYFIPDGGGETDFAPNRTLKRTRCPRLLGTFDIVSNMHSIVHHRWNAYPEALIWNTDASVRHGRSR